MKSVLLGTQGHELYNLVDFRPDSHTLTDKSTINMSEDFMKTANSFFKMLSKQ